MTRFRFYHPIEVRYGDLDPQGHLNNARYLTYLEQGRINYLKQLGLWKGISFMDLGIILADLHISFREPVQFGQPVRVGVRVARLGTKSLDMEYRIEDAVSRKEFASASSVLVAYDYPTRKTVLVPQNWRQAILKFEDGLD